MQLSVLLPLILAACSGPLASAPGGDDKASGDTAVCEFGPCSECEYGSCYGSCNSVAVESETFQIGAEEFLEALGDDEVLSEAMCEQLCRSGFDEQVKFVAEVRACSDDGQAPGESDGDRLIRCAALAGYTCFGRTHEGASGFDASAGRNPRAAWLAWAAHCEATSVASFVGVRREIRALGAPDDLLERCLSAARDEVRHARVLGRLAERAGGRTAPVAFGPRRHRLPIEIAIENAVEGCVRESFAAIVALHQAQVCPDPELREAMRTIAADEVGHAQLSQDLHRWLWEQLDEEERALVIQARAQALDGLVQHWEERGEREEEEEALGLPTPRRGLEMSRMLREGMV
jgi:hypothetical protein